MKKTTTSSSSSSQNPKSLLLLFDTVIKISKAKIHRCIDHNNIIEITFCSEGDDVGYTVTDINRVDCIKDS